MQPKRLLVHSHQMYGQYSDVRSFRFEGLAVLHRFAPLGMGGKAPQASLCSAWGAKRCKSNAIPL